MTDIDKLKDEVVEAACAYVVQTREEEHDLSESSNEFDRRLGCAVKALEAVLRPDPLDLLRQADALMTEAAMSGVEHNIDERMADLQERIKRALTHG